MIGRRPRDLFAAMLPDQVLWGFDTARSYDTVHRLPGKVLLAFMIEE